MTAIDHRLYNFIRSKASQRTRKKILRILFKSKTTFGRLFQWVNGSFDAEGLLEHLKSMIHEDFDIVMVHSSMNALLVNYRGDMLQIVAALLSLCGDTRTLAMPAFSFNLPRHFDENREKELPYFDVLRTPSQMGLLTELFRRYEGVRRSMHPTLSVSACGPLADELTRGHELAGTSSGYGTPFDTMTKYRTVIIGLGVKYYRSLTQVHSAESILGEKYPMKLRTSETEVHMSDCSGQHFYYHLAYYQDSRVSHRGHDIIKPYLKKEELVEWKFHGIPMYRTNAAAITRAVLEAARDGKTIYDRP